MTWRGVAVAWAAAYGAIKGFLRCQTLKTVNINQLSPLPCWTQYTLQKLPPAMKAVILTGVVMSAFWPTFCHGGISAAQLDNAAQNSFTNSDASLLKSAVAEENLPNELKAAAQISISIIDSLKRSGIKLDDSQSALLVTEISSLYKPANPDQGRKDLRDKLNKLTASELNKFVERSLAPVNKSLKNQKSINKMGDKLDFEKFRNDIHIECKFWPFCWLMG
ncbi:MAG: hypothetical protein ABIS50_03690 [Luteolibacter sp.]|uniref:hypothetical protein n=1 Tax=Luteolibacter sp. TaxID=1962973 RepID=UPI0032655A50